MILAVEPYLVHVRPAISSDDQILGHSVELSVWVATPPSEFQQFILGHARSAIERSSPSSGARNMTFDRILLYSEVMSRMCCRGIEQNRRINQLRREM